MMYAEKNGGICKVVFHENTWQYLKYSSKYMILNRLFNIK